MPTDQPETGTGGASGAAPVAVGTTPGALKAVEITVEVKPDDVEAEGQAQIFVQGAEGSCYWFRAQDGRVSDNCTTTVSSYVAPNRSGFDWVVVVGWDGEQITASKAIKIPIKAAE